MFSVRRADSQFVPRITSGNAYNTFWMGCLYGCSEQPDQHRRASKDHVATCHKYGMNQYHGALWKAEMRRLASLGAFDDLLWTKDVDRADPKEFLGIPINETKLEAH